MPSKTENFIERMSGVFGPPNGEIGRVMAAHLMPFSPEILQAVAENFILTRKWKTWPMPVEVIGACKDEAAKLAPASKPKRKDDPWDEHRCKRADRLIECELGVQAAEGGWLDELWHFCRKHERLPDRHETDAVCRDAEKHMRSRDETFEKIANDANWRGRTYGLRATLLGLHETMQLVSNERAERVKAWAKRAA